MKEQKKCVDCGKAIMRHWKRCNECDRPTSIVLDGYVKPEERISIKTYGKSLREQKLESELNQLRGAYDRVAHDLNLLEAQHERLQYNFERLAARKVTLALEKNKPQTTI
jgi:hypothetical protein